MQTQRETTNEALSDRFGREVSLDAASGFKRIMIQQMLSVVGMQVFDWVMAKPGRRFVFESGAEGAGFRFEEEGKEAVPGFMGGERQ